MAHRWFLSYTPRILPSSSTTALLYTTPGMSFSSAMGAMMQQDFSSDSARSVVMVSPSNFWAKQGILSPISPRLYPVENSSGRQMMSAPFSAASLHRAAAWAVLPAVSPRLPPNWISAILTVLICSPFLHSTDFAVQSDTLLYWNPLLMTITNIIIISCVNIQQAIVIYIEF